MKTNGPYRNKSAISISEFLSVTGPYWPLLALNFFPLRIANCWKRYLFSDLSPWTATEGWRELDMVVRLFVGLAKLVACSYGTLVGIIFIFQRKLQYFPLAKRPPHPSHFSPCFATVEDVFVLTTDNVRLDGWFWPADKNRKHGNISILHLHGNAGHRQHRLGWAYAVRQRYGLSLIHISEPTRPY